MKQKTIFYQALQSITPSDKLHIGHAYCTTIADAVARFQKIGRARCLFSDRVGRARPKDPAQSSGKREKVPFSTWMASWHPSSFCGRNWGSAMMISFGQQRPRHHEVVQAIFQKIYDQGRYLQGGLRRLVLHSVRNVLAGKTAERRQLPGLRTTGREGAGRKLFFPYVQVSGPPSEAY